MPGLDPVDKEELKHWCMNEGNDGFICSLESGHGGSHKALDTISGFTYDTWANYNDPVK